MPRHRRHRSAHAAAGSGTPAHVVVDDVAVAQRHPPGRPGGDVAVVGDQHDRAPGAVELLQQGDDGVAVAAVEVAGRLVGEHDRRLADEGAGDGHALALAAGQRAGPVAGPGRQPDRVQRLAGRGRPAAGGGRRGRAGRRRRCRARVSPSTRWNCWNTKPMRRARTAASRASRSRLTSWPAMRTVPPVGRWRAPTMFINVDLPDPDGPTTTTNSPSSTRRSTPSSARTGGSAGIVLGHAGRARARRSRHHHLVAGRDVAGDLDQPSANVAQLDADEARRRRRRTTSRA